jgi:16S rRNA (adenine1518-N6/adenine1519-N6)-dimethyltransferase
MLIWKSLAIWPRVKNEFGIEKRDGGTGRRGDRGDGETGKKQRQSNQQSRLPRTTVSASPRPPVPPPSKRLGQHFLTDPRIIDRIINELDPKPDETIVEIGPGRGALTSRLIPRVERLVAIEFDRKLIPLLAEQFGADQNFRLVQSDALVTDFCAEILPATSARLVANLPYNISTAILQRLIEQRGCLSEMVLMLQREVVERITAPAGSTDRGYLSVLVEAYSETEKLFDVAPGAFRPAPKVWSSVIRLRLRPRLPVEVKHESLLWALVSAGFAQRRKTIFNNLRSVPPNLLELIKHHGGASIVLCRAEVDLQRRAETLTLEEWARIAQVLE